jgi:hypothetical protein
MRDAGKQLDRLAALRLRYTINAHLDDQGITAPSDIARAVGLPAAEAVRLLNVDLEGLGSVTGKEGKR